MQLIDWLLAAALAANPPAVAVPSGQFVVPGSAVTLSGASISELGAGPTVNYTTTIAATGILTATGAVVTGSGTSSLSITGTSAQTDTALATLAVNETCSVPAQCNDVLTFSVHDNTNNLSGTQQQVAIVADGNKYLTFSTLAAAQARSATQCNALSCDGVQTVRWWPVVATATGGAVQIQPGTPCMDAVVTAFCGIAKTRPPAQAVVGLSSLEQSSLVTAPNAGFTAPTISNGVVTP